MKQIGDSFAKRTSSESVFTPQCWHPERSFPTGVQMRLPCRFPALLSFGIVALLLFAVDSSYALGQGYRLGIDVAIEPGRGLRVVLVRPGSAATRMSGSGIIAAMEPGDVLVRINGRFLDSINTLQQQLAATNGAVTIDVLDVNSGAVRRWSVQADRVGAVGGGGGTGGRRVVRRPSLTRRWSLGLGISEVQGRGLRVESVQAGGPCTQLVLTRDASVRGLLEPGDLVVAVNGTMIDSASVLQRVLDQNQGRVTLTVWDAKHGNLRWHARAVATSSGVASSGTASPNAGKPVTAGLRRPRLPPAVPQIP